MAQPNTVILADRVGDKLYQVTPNNMNAIRTEENSNSVWKDKKSRGGITK